MAPPTVAPPLVALRQAAVTFGGRPLFAGLDIALTPGERGCLVGRNGCGKSTLLKLLAGQIELDGGERWMQPGTRIAYLPQDPQFGSARTVREYVLAAVPPETGPTGEARALAILDKLGSDLDGVLADLSGGEGRRADLARALASDPEVLLLDEPTNHLDLPSITWLEERLAGFRGAVLAISHDRSFLRAMSNRTWYLDRGMLRRLDRGFEGFEEWVEELAAQEEAEAHKTERRILSETKWMREGISARRKRNMGRVRALLDLRQNFAERVKATGRATLDAASAEQRGGTLVIEATGICKAYGERTILDHVGTRILRGARVGIIGPNGAGKSTLLRILTGQMEPDAGTVKLGQGLAMAYYDQRRTHLDPDLTLWKTLCPGGGDQVMVGGKPRHVVGYLKDFLFSEAQAMAPVHTLSGGERSRLLLALLFAAPSNFAVLDEPTNDLDVDTLDLLQDMLADYDGTVLLVSHDRDFLDRVATSILAVEGDGKAVEYAGGYSDYLSQRPPPASDSKSKAAKAVATATSTPAPKRERLSYKEQREREQLPDRIAALESQIAHLETTLADPTLYTRDPGALDRTARALDAARTELATAEERWLELEMKVEELAAAKG